MGTGDLKCYQFRGLNTFWGLFFFFFLNQSFICHGNQFSSLFSILQEHMSLWPQCNIFVTPPTSWCSKWHHNNATMMLLQRDIHSSPVRVKVHYRKKYINLNVPAYKTSTLLYIVIKCDVYNSLWLTGVPIKNTFSLSRIPKWGNLSGRSSCIFISVN